MMEILFLRLNALVCVHTHIKNVITYQTKNDWQVGSRRRGPEIKACCLKIESVNNIVFEASCPQKKGWKIKLIRAVQQWD